MSDEQATRAVVDTIVRFGRALDDRDWAALRGCLAAELDTDYSSFRGTPPARLTADEFVALRRDGLAELVTQHLSTGHLVDITNDVAICRCDFVIRRWPADVADQRFLHSYGCYTFVLRRIPRGWEITGITQAVRRNEGDPGIHGAFGRRSGR